MCFPLEDYRRTDAVKHHITTGEAAPCRERFRGLPLILYEEGMLEKDVIKASCSPWAASVVLVQKKCSAWRVGVDKLNSATHKYAFPLHTEGSKLV